MSPANLSYENADEAVTTMLGAFAAKLVLSMMIVQITHRLFKSLIDCFQNKDVCHLFQA